MIKLEITADNAADLRAQLAALLGGNSGPVAAAAPAAEAAAPAAEKAQTRRTPPKATEEKAPVEEPKADEPKALDFNTDVAPVVVDTVEKYGKPVVLEVLAQFGAAKASEVPEAQWGELVAALTDAAAAATPLA